MARRFFRAEVAWTWIDTHQGLMPAPRVELPVRFSEGEGRFGPPILCQWDSGSHLSVISEPLAHDLGIDLNREPDTGLRGVTGVGVPAWLAERYVRFPELGGWQFKFQFLIPQGVPIPIPLVGMLDTLGNFELIQHGLAYYFFLAEGHRGEPC